MSTFPPLTPSGTRTFTPGERPHTPQRSMGGGASLVLHSDGIVGQRLRLSFLRLTEAEMRQIRAHYISRRGRFYGFDLPDEVWSASTSTQTPSAYQWHYASTPQVSDVFCGRHDVQIELEMLPREVPAIPIPAAVIAAAGVVPVIVADLNLKPPRARVTVAGIPPQVSTT
jgi:hypothetical protein